MTRHRLTIAAATTAVLLATSSIGAHALDVKASVGGVNANVSVGGKGGGGATAKASVGNAASATASVGGGGNGGSTGGGGGGGNIASTTATVGNNSVTANVGTGNGPLVDSQTRGNPDGLTSDNAINLGNLFGIGGDSGGGGSGNGGNGNGGGVADGGGNGNGGGGKGDGGGVATDSVRAAIAGMSDGEVATMKRRCNSILAMPTGYDQGIIDLCRLLRSL